MKLIGGHDVVSFCILMHIIPRINEKTYCSWIIHRKKGKQRVVFDSCSPSPAGAHDK